MARDTATTNQGDFIDALLHDIEDLDPDGFQTVCARDDVRRHQTGADITKRAASELIEQLIAVRRLARASYLTDEQRAAIAVLRTQVRSNFAASIVTQFDKQGGLTDRQWEAVLRTTAPAPSEEVDAQGVGDGIYFHEGSYIKVVVAKNGSGNRYAKRWVPMDGGVKWQYESGLIRHLRPEHKVTAEQAAEFGRLYGVCCFCTRDLTDERSIAVGYGPVCAGYNDLPWGHVAEGDGARVPA